MAVRPLSPDGGPPPTPELADLFDGTTAVVPDVERPRAGAAAEVRRPAVAAGVAPEVADLLDGTLYVGRRPSRRHYGARARAAARVAAPPLLAAALAIVLWEVWVQLRDVPEYMVPAPSVVGQELWADPSRYLEAGRTSLVEALGGLAIGSGAAFLLAVVMAHSRPLERALYPLALFVKVTPIIAVVPLFIIWFGFGIWPKLFVAALITFFPMLVNAVIGLRSVDPAAHDFLRALHAPWWQVLWRLRLPASLPYVFAALRISVPLSLLGAVVAEWVSGSSGIGQVILVANGDLDTAALFAAIVVLAAIAIMLTALLALLERRLLFWHESSSGL
jgi:NitT/TauT family transport system permease protein